MPEARCLLLSIFLLAIGASDTFSLDPGKKNDPPVEDGGLSRREVLAIPLATGGAVVYGRVLSGALKKLERGDLVYPRAHETRLASTISEALLACLPQNDDDKNRNDAGDNVFPRGRPLRILEVGIGKDCRILRRGLYADAWAKLSAEGVKDVELVGLDVAAPAPAALEQARASLTQKETAGTNVSLEVVRGDLTSRLDFEDEHFDCVLCTLTLCSVEDPVAALRELRRVLRTNGGSFGYLEHVAVNPDEPYRLLEFQQLAFDGIQQVLADNCHLHRYTEETISEVFGLEEGRSQRLANERFLVDDMWPVSCQTRGVIRLNAQQA